MSIYNFSAIEKKWRGKWEVSPINVNDGKKPKYYLTPFNSFLVNSCVVSLDMI